MSGRAGVGGQADPRIRTSLNFTLLCHIREIGDQNPVLAELTLRILKRFREEGIKFPFPTRTVYIKEAGTDR